MRFELMWKDQNSGKDGCPALYQTDSDFYGVVGLVPEPSRHPEAGEATVLVPHNVLDRLPALGDGPAPFATEGGFYRVVGQAISTPPRLEAGVGEGEGVVLVRRDVLDRPPARG